MKTINIFFIRTFMALMFLYSMNSCDSFVDVDLPTSQLTKTSVFEDYRTTDAALTDIYSKIRDRGLLTGARTGISNHLGNYTDELMAYGAASNTSWSYFNNTLVPVQADISEYWNSAYNQIYAANSIIEGTENSAALNELNKKQLKGESLFIRALVHFYLTNLFGDVPYIQDTDYKENSTATKIPQNEVYKLIITDLQNAILLLPEQYSSAERVRPNKYTAKALLARVYLYSDAFAEASNEASSVLNMTDTFTLTQNTNQVFLIGSKETIWQLKPSATGQNTKEGSTFIIVAGPPSTCGLTTSLVNSFASEDRRRINWIKSVTSGSSTWYFSYKYKERTTTSPSREYSIVFRLSELFLIRAEARARQGDLIGAKEDLNLIRQRAGLSDSPAVSKEEVLEAVLQERRWELFTEFGHRFFDLKRFDKINSVLSSVKPGWNSDDKLLPIPERELRTNPKLGSQNPGY
ncbi:RagB/SusD family nutrient uptake outer membrane protein [Flavobacterium johnsoniae]|uniref:RagB/SusD family nutrient uptake outer membrane protein n=1 Tax=Flavobacterium johnsoniae TaxID=986 RepID=UPI003D95B3D2